MLLSVMLASAMISSTVTVKELPNTTIVETSTWVREERPVTLGAEFGWNGLGGLAVTGSYNFNWRFSLDSAVGLSLTGPKLGLRARYNFLPGNVTPFVGLGGMYSFGLDGSSQTRVDDKLVTSRVKSKGAPHVQGVAGLSWVTDGGFSLMASAGYSHRFGSDTLVTRTTADDTKTMTAAFGSGLALSLGMGYAF